MRLFISGRVFKCQKLPPYIERVKAYLERARDGELFTTDQLALALRLNPCVLRTFNTPLRDYYHVHKNKKYWGKPATIKAFVKEVSQ